MRLKVRGLVKEFSRGAGMFGSKWGGVRALDHFDLNVEPGVAVALVGESGCGKTTAGRAILGLIQPTRGQVYWDDRVLEFMTPSERRAARRRAQMVFQDSAAALDPRRAIGWSIAEPLVVHGERNRAGLQARVQQLLTDVGLPADAATRYPHEFSGGQRQRIGVARALALDPELLVADEPTSAQDVSVRARILELLKEQRSRRAMSVVFISHDLASVRHFADRVAVMFAGRIIEEAPTRTLFTQPLHPYTKALLAAVPVPEFHRIQPGAADTACEPMGGGDPRDPIGSGCAYAGRCPMAEPRCRQSVPALLPAGRDQNVACHLLATADTGAPRSEDNP